LRPSTEIASTRRSSGTARFADGAADAVDAVDDVDAVEVRDAVDAGAGVAPGDVLPGPEVQARVLSTVRARAAREVRRTPPR